MAQISKTLSLLGIANGSDNIRTPIARGSGSEIRRCQYAFGLERSRADHTYDRHNALVCAQAEAIRLVGLLRYCSVKDHRPWAI